MPIIKMPIIIVIIIHSMHAPKVTQYRVLLNEIVGRTKKKGIRCTYSVG